MTAIQIDQLLVFAGLCVCDMYECMNIFSSQTQHELSAQKRFFLIQMSNRLYIKCAKKTENGQKFHLRTKVSIATNHYQHHNDMHMTKKKLEKENVACHLLEIQKLNAIEL